MGILSSIFSKLFPPSHPANSAAAAPLETQASAAPADSTDASATGATAATSAPAAAEPVDIQAVLEEMAQHNPEPLNWQTSIVDLMKLLGLDSSLQARKLLAHELDYSGDTNDSATMNVWLHREVMNRVAANGGTVPADLRA